MPYMNVFPGGLILFSHHPSAFETTPNENTPIYPGLRYQ